MKYFSTFTGVLGFDMGLPGDWQCVGVSEIDKHACKVIRYRKPGVKNYGDIEKIRYEELPDFDILIGGSPCQGLSMAGKRKGLDDSRSRLFFSYIEILKEKKPLYFIFENVKGLLSSNAGWDFATVVREFTEAGYDIWWQVLDAAWYGIPQHRERIFICGTLRDRGFRQVFFKPEYHKNDNVVQRQTASAVTASYRHKETERGNLVVESERNPQANTLGTRYKAWGDRGSFVIETVHNDPTQPYRIYGTRGVAPTLRRKTGGQQVTKIVASRGRMVDGKWVQRLEERTDVTNTLTSVQKDNMVSDNAKIRYLTPLECERLMGWPDNHTKYGIDDQGKTVELSDNARYNLIGNGVVPQVVAQIIYNIIL